MATKQFTTAVRNKQVIEFDLDDDTYHFTPPKRAAVVLDLLTADSAERAAAKASLDWLSQGLPTEENERLISRLRDPNDDLDFPDLALIIEWLVEESSGNPTPPR